MPNASALRRTQIVGRAFADTLAEDAPAELETLLRQALRGGDAPAHTWMETPAAGATKATTVRMLPHAGVGAQPQRGVLVVITQDTPQASNSAASASRVDFSRSSRFAQASSEGLVFHRDGIVLDANDVALALIGISLDELVGRSVLEFLPEIYRPLVASYLEQEREDPYEVVLLHRLGHEVPVEVVGKTIAVDGEPVRLAVVRDLTARRAQQRQIEFLAHHDALTELPNRTFMLQRLEQLLALARRHETRVAVLFVDLDKFKLVNDQHGHHVGDRLLQTVAQRLRHGVRDSDVVCRLGGDEFVVVLAELSVNHDAAMVATKLLAAVGAPTEIEGHTLSISPSIGIGLFPDDGASPDELIRHADAAMYHAKANGRNNYQFFEPSMREHALGLADARAASARGAGHRRVPSPLPAAVARGGWHARRHRRLAALAPSGARPDRSRAVRRVRRGARSARLGRHLDVAPGLPAAGRVATRGTGTGSDRGEPVNGRIATTRDWPSRFEDILAETSLPAHRLELGISEATLAYDRRPHDDRC